MMTPRKLANLTWPQGHFSHINFNNNYIVFSIGTYAFISVMLLLLEKASRGPSLALPRQKYLV